MKPFEKVIRLGERPHVGSVYCKIEYRVDSDGKDRLSITGVEGPKSNGDARGSCGQIEMSLADGADIVPAPGWTPDTIAQFLNVWRVWHLNDMRAGCEHQRASWNPGESIEIVTYKLTSETLSAQNKLKRETDDKLARGEMVQLTGDALALTRLPYTTTQAPDADSFASGCYQVDKRETKTAGWVRHDEHSRGLLSKPCETCGYKYGNAWLHEPVPDDVLAWLQGLPDTDRKPAWV